MSNIRTLYIYRPPSASLRCLVAGNYCERTRACYDEIAMFSATSKKCEWCGRKFESVAIVVGCEGELRIESGDCSYMANCTLESL